ncbi:NADP-dependent oxidoreductase [Microbacterium pseudoresistens]|uniref:NADPH:quinone reductase-like Zn-dependent oxidoreductase n=1 Tax=Microbacterium pseudoresistens TaxID=640634 RepID=A0A7Y9ESK4_9MICO|nr:NADP-dependent oxidoreductase [Microbacterium pseudoresistens]NYD53192.1 NADPH:quinone reductase-like Zn-dependent oxidoreductase [Microbacterium pseudoresistens]
MAHAIVHSKTGGPEVLRLVDIPVPVPAPDEVVVRIDAAGVNPLDAKQRSGIRPVPAFTERRVGFDGAGVITALGAEVEGLAVGDRVVIRDTLGTYATDLAVPAVRVALIPEGVTSAQAAAVPIPAGTAYQVVRSMGIDEADVVLLHNGSGAVGQAAIQFAVQAGATVIATGGASSQERLRTLGAIPVQYGEGVSDAIREAAPGPITVALDFIGTDEAIAVSKEFVADGSRIATIVRGPDAAELGIRAFSGGSPEPLTAQELAWRREAIPETMALIADGRFSVEFGAELPLAEAAEAHRMLESHAVRGKIILLP